MGFEPQTSEVVLFSIEVKFILFVEDFTSNHSSLMWEKPGLGISSIHGRHKISESGALEVWK